MDKKFLSLGVALAFVATLCTPLVEAGSLSGQLPVIQTLVVLHGTVTGSDTGGVGLFDVKLVLKDNAVNGAGTTIFTDAIGSYSLSSLESGHFFDLVFRKPGYIAQANTILLPDLPDYNFSPILQKR